MAPARCLETSPLDEGRALWGRGALCTSTFGTAGFDWNRPLNGTSADISFSGQAIRTTVPGTVTNTIGFAGSLRDGVVSGTLTVTDAQSLRNPHPQVSSVTGGGSASFPVTLR